MYHIRTTKTASGAIAVQIVFYKNRKLIVARHIASAHTAEQLKAAKMSAQKWIEKVSNQPPLFPDQKNISNNLIPLQKCRYLGFRYYFLYETFVRVFAYFKIRALRQNLLTNLAIMRIVEPTSKLQALWLIKEYFGIRHSRKCFYEMLPKTGALKDRIETKVLAIAKKELNFDFSLVFYDVTTLYFESSQSDDFRKTGFSKDNKPQQPQILVALIVNKEGFPVAYEIFEGSKFEGHTLIPVITAFKRKHKIKTATVVADAAMLSLDNIKQLTDNHLCYIVGVRTGNLPISLIRIISSKLGQRDGASLRFATNHGTLICDFSLKRYRKDKQEMERQIKKAKNLLKEPWAIKRTKFLKNKNNIGYALNIELIQKTKLLLGIKGYYTNLGSEVSNTDIISHYRNLWHVEQAFRIAKSDLKIRPIYHFKRYAIEAHVLICFMALAVSKYMEIKTGRSIKSMNKLFKSVTDARILNTLTNKEIILRSDLSEELKQILSKLNLSY